MSRLSDQFAAIIIFLASSGLFVLFQDLYFKRCSSRRGKRKFTVLLSTIFSLTAFWMAYLAISPSINKVLTGLALCLISLPMLRLAYKWHRRQTKKIHMRKDLPILLDSMVLSVEAGQSLLPAFFGAQKTLSENSYIREAIVTLQTDLELGLSKKAAIEKMRSDHSGSQFSLFVDAIAQSIKLGTPIAKILREQSERNREFLIMEGEKYANTLSIKLLIPLLLFIFPAAFLVILSPIIVFLFEQSPW